MPDDTPTPSGPPGNPTLYAGAWQEGYSAGYQRAQREGKQPGKLTRVHDEYTGKDKSLPGVPPELSEQAADDAAEKYIRKVYLRYKEAYKDGYKQGHDDSRIDLEDERREGV
jgi:hypothetical protein